jgi:hypothetical protein
MSPKQQGFFCKLCQKQTEHFWSPIIFFKLYQRLKKNKLELNTELQDHNKIYCAICANSHDSTLCFQKKMENSKKSINFYVHLETVYFVIIDTSKTFEHKKTSAKIFHKDLEYFI